jgi:hypothetical protein
MILVFAVDIYRPTPQEDEDERDDWVGDSDYSSGDDGGS